MELQHFVVRYLGIQLFLIEEEKESRLDYDSVYLGASKGHQERIRRMHQAPLLH